jgi:hypothetical protein
MTYGSLPGGGSIPAWVMRVGQTMPFDPMNARQDIKTQDVQDETAIPVAQQPGAMAGGLSGAFGAVPWNMFRNRGQRQQPAWRGRPPATGWRHSALPPPPPPPPQAMLPPPPPPPPPPHRDLVRRGFYGAEMGSWATMTTPTKIAIGGGAVIVAGAIVWGLIRAFD